ncbi:MAG: hypothetical protein AAF616_06925 [Bacteroidota bacterium]
MLSHLRYLILLLLLVLSNFIAAQRKGFFEEMQALIIERKGSYEEAVNRDDSSSMINALHELGRLNNRVLNFAESIDYFSQSLKLSELRADTSNLIRNYESIGSIYRTFRRDDTSLSYFENALNMTKILVLRGELDSLILLRSYKKMASLHRNFGNNDTFQSYLDSAFVINSRMALSSKDVLDLKIEEAFLLYSLGSIEMAIDSLRKIEGVFQNTRPFSKPTDLSPLMSIYAKLAGAYDELDDYEMALAYYQKGIKIADSINLHFGHQAYLYQFMASLQFRNGFETEAYQNLNKSLSFQNKYFSAKGLTGKKLLDIKTDYLDRLEANEKQLIKQELVIAQQNNEVLWTRSIAAIAVLLLVVGVLVMMNNNQKTRARAEKKMLERESERKQIEAQTLIDQKNRELTSFTLKLIEKDEIISRAAEVLEANPQNQSKDILNSLRGSSVNNWEEFNQRFVSVNPDFYHRLTKEFPNLTSNDLKICALIKLNFSNKEMSQLLGISQSSVNMARYRLRTKMNLEREANLTSVIASI